MRPRRDTSPVAAAVVILVHLYCALRELMRSISQPSHSSAPTRANVRHTCLRVRFLSRIQWRAASEVMRRTNLPKSTGSVHTWWKLGAKFFFLFFFFFFYFICFSPSLTLFDFRFIFFFPSAFIEFTYKYARAGTLIGTRANTHD